MWDEETGLYYLNSRYYDAGVKRFLNSDDTNVLACEQNTAVQFNLFAYALNNPIKNSDPNGNLNLPATLGFLPTLDDWIINTTLTYVSTAVSAVGTSLGHETGDSIRSAGSTSSQGGSSNNSTSTPTSTSWLGVGKNIGSAQGVTRCVHNGIRYVV